MLDREQVDVASVEAGVIVVKVEVFVVEIKVATVEVKVLVADFGFIIRANDSRQLQALESLW